MFTVIGIPVPQGSKRLGAHGQMFDVKSKQLEAWREHVAWTVKASWRQPLIEGAVAMSLLFRVPRPKSNREPYPSRQRTGDVDKLQRAVFDALTGIVYADDSQVCRVLATKAWAQSVRDVGVQITVEAIGVRGPKPEPDR